MSKRDTECSAPDFKLTDVKDRSFLFGKKQDNVFTWEESLQADLWFQVGPCNVRNGDTISPEEDIWSLTIMGKVLDIDCLLIQDKDVPSHTV